MSPEERKRFGCRHLEMAWKSYIFVMCFALHCKSNMCDLNHYIVTSVMREIICRNVGQSQECRQCGDERVLMFKVDFKRTVNLISNYCILRCSILHDALINFSHLKGSEKYFWKCQLGWAALQVSKGFHLGCSPFHLPYCETLYIHDVSINVSHLKSIAIYLKMSAACPKKCPNHCFPEPGSPH